jgi:predicted nucleic acid-binding protein
MPRERLKVFLDANVLIEALRGSPGASALFTRQSEEAASYVVTPVVVQELLLASPAIEAQESLDNIIQHLNVVSGETPSSPEVVATIRSIRNRLVHTNDLLILGAARDCDLLLTYDQDLLRLGDAIGVESKTPEEFLAALGAES